MVEIELPVFWNDFYCGFLLTVVKYQIKVFQYGLGILTFIRPQNDE
jgi:hypothetical protein